VENKADMKYKVLMCNDVMVDFGRLINGIYATPTPHLWPSNTTREHLSSGFEMVYTDTQIASVIENFNRCSLVDVELTIL